MSPVKIAPIIGIAAECGIFRWTIARTDAENEASSRERVDGNCALRNMKRMSECQYDRAADKRDVFRIRCKRAEQYPRIEMSDRIGVIDAIERHVADPERAKAESVGELRKCYLLAEIDDALIVTRYRQCNADG